MELRERPVTVTKTKGIVGAGDVPASPSSPTSTSSARAGARKGGMEKMENAMRALCPYSY